MNSFVNANEVNEEDIEIDYKIEEEVETFLKYVINEYKESVLEAFLTIFQKYSLDFLMTFGIYHIRNEQFNNYLIKLKSKYFDCIHCLTKNNYKNGKILLDDLINNFSVLYTFDLSKSKSSIKDIKYGLSKLNYTMIYLRAYLENRVTI